MDKYQNKYRIPSSRAQWWDYGWNGAYFITICTANRRHYYKSAVTKHANRMNLRNGWQTRFHDHIIRDDAEYQRISNYIINNPAKWNEDGFRN